MKFTKINAIFNGRDGSMGFRHGRNYELVIATNPTVSGFEFYITNDTVLEAEVQYRIPYQSIHAFLKNWTGINFIAQMGDDKVYDDLHHYQFISKIPADI